MIIGDGVTCQSGAHKKPARVLARRLRVELQVGITECFRTRLEALNLFF